MAQCISFFCVQQLKFSPAKTSFTTKLILRNPCVILQPSSPPPSLTFSKMLNSPLRASPPQKYTYPDPIPEFAQAETRKFRVELLKKLSKDRESFGDDLHTVVEVCVEIFSDFLHKEYGGPGTLLVEPFTDILVVLKKRKLPGAPLAARTSLLWAQSCVDKDWEIWNSNTPN